MKNTAFIREYNTNDKEKVLHLFRLNTPEFFSPEEEVDLVYYLENEIDHYYILEIESEIVGCGGIKFAENKTIGKISWDFLHPDFQGKGLGSLLLKYRIEKLKEIKQIQKIIVRTSQLVYPFYEKSGFVLTEKVKDYWAEGYDLYMLEYS